MTAGELCDTLRGLPRNLPVFLRVDRDVTVRNAVNDCIDGHLEDDFEVAVVDMEKTFSLGKGWHTAVFLVAEGEA